ncbi:LysR family transcriptional regulator [Sphingobium sp.]|uniref:LysR family transcriptional regulator n=1 Tax=Sphingobium sp. TaxID=1912891 RepID=UPI002D0C9A41|nr:LysR family transcriptional regulator [Sphingobium sp.]HUD92028.1 LysR family transcriptional regulator [Sphingobium sp.]
MRDLRTAHICTLIALAWSFIIKLPDLNLLMTLSVLLQTRSVSRTAQRLGLSQPTVSRSLGQLRQMMADPLLVRSGSGMTVTRRALELAEPLENWLAMSSALLMPDRFDPRELTRAFHISSTDFGVLSVLTPALPQIKAAAPGCSIEISAFSHDMFKRLMTGELDLIISGLEPDLSLAHARYLFSETQSCVMSAAHPLAHRPAGDPMSIDDYLAWPHVAIAIGEQEFDHVDASLADRASQRSIMARLPYFYAAPDLLGSSRAILTLPTRAAHRLAASHGLACFSAPMEIKGFDYWLLWHERSARDPAILWLIDELSLAQSAPRA